MLGKCGEILPDIRYLEIHDSASLLSKLVLYSMNLKITFMKMLCNRPYLGSYGGSHAGTKKMVEGNFRKAAVCKTFDLNLDLQGSIYLENAKDCKGNDGRDIEMLRSNESES